MIGLNKNITLKMFGDDCLDTETEARRQAKERDLIFISPYNDYNVLVGQGTIGVEISEQIKKNEPNNSNVGGGGLIGGIAGYFKQQSFPQTKIIGVQPINDNAMYQSIKEGKNCGYKS